MSELKTTKIGPVIYHILEMVQVQDGMKVAVIHT